MKTFSMNQLVEAQVTHVCLQHQYVSPDFFLSFCLNSCDVAALRGKYFINRNVESHGEGIQQDKLGERGWAWITCYFKEVRCRMEREEKGEVRLSRALTCSE